MKRVSVEEKSKAKNAPWNWKHLDFAPCRPAWPACLAHTVNTIVFPTPTWCYQVATPTRGSFLDGTPTCQNQWEWFSLANQCFKWHPTGQSHWVGPLTRNRGGGGEMLFGQKFLTLTISDGLTSHRRHLCTPFIFPSQWKLKPVWKKKNKNRQHQVTVAWMSPTALKKNHCEMFTCSATGLQAQTRFLGD